MAVHHFTAPDMVVQRGAWQSMDTFPKDGTVVEVKDESGFICKAQWHSERILCASLSLSTPKEWRHLE